MVRRESERSPQLIVRRGRFRFESLASAMFRQDPGSALCRHFSIRSCRLSSPVIPHPTRRGQRRSAAVATCSLYREFVPTSLLSVLKEELLGVVAVGPSGPRPRHL